MKRRLLATLLCLCMALTLLPTAALAATMYIDREPSGRNGYTFQVSYTGSEPVSYQWYRPEGGQANFTVIDVGQTPGESEICCNYRWSGSCANGVWSSDDEHKLDVAFPAYAGDTVQIQVSGGEEVTVQDHGSKQSYEDKGSGLYSFVVQKTGDSNPEIASTAAFTATITVQRQWDALEGETQAALQTREPGEYFCVATAGTARKVSETVTIGPAVARLDYTASGAAKAATFTEDELQNGARLSTLLGENADADTPATLTVLTDSMADLGLDRSVTLTSGDGGPYTLKRDPAEYQMRLLEVTAPVTVTDLILDGSVTEPKSSEAPRFIEVSGGSLTLGDGATVQNCQPNTKHKKQPPAAVYVSGGSLIMESGSKIVNNQSQMGGVVREYGADVSLSGNVTIKGNEALDFDTGATVPANLVVCAPMPKARHESVQVTGALTGGEKSIGISLVDGLWDPQPTTGPVVEGAGYDLTETDLAAFFSDRPGYFLELADNTISLEEYAITTQPTAEVPTVAVNQTKDAAYQWYPATLVTEDITDQNTVEGPYPCTYADGKWTAGADSFGDKGWFTLDLKKGDIITVTVAEGETIPTDDGLCLNDLASGEMDSVSYQPDKTVYTLTAPADGTYTLEPFMGNTVPVISATVTKVQLGQAVSGQDTDTLAAPVAGDYLCQISYPDGTVLQSDLISVAAAPHKHAMSVDCETTGEGLVTFDKALTVNDEGVLCVNGAALTPDTYGNYTLAGGNYYLPGDVTLNGDIIIRDADDAPTNLCLGGHTLDLGAGRIDIDASNNNGNGVLNLCDCGAEGKVTSAYSGAYSNAATIEVGYQFSLYGGTVENTAASDTVSSNRNAVGFNGGRLNLYSGKLTSQNGNGLWVYCYYQTKSLTLSGDVAIQGGTGQAEVYFSYPSTTWEDSTHFTLAGPLTRPVAPWRVAVDYPEAEAMPLLEGWATHMADQDFTGYFQSATKGLFIGQLENKNLVLDICAITQQPAAANGYIVAANGAPASAPAYQWYPAAVTTADITDQNAELYQDDMMGSQPVFADGKWTASEGGHGIPGYFTMSLKKGDKVAVTLATADKPSDGQLGLVRDYSEPGAYVQVWYPFDGDPEGYSYVGTAVTDGDNTVITYAIPADGSYDLRIDGLYGDEQTAPVISATLTRAQPGAALTGQTDPKLNTTGLAGGTYLCQVTWADGTVMNSDVVAYAPPAHVHDWATAWSKNETHHWHECTADGCDVTENSGKDGYAAHAATGDWQKDETNHWKLCVCGQELSKTAHVYDDDADTTCNTCGYERSVTPPTPDQGEAKGEVEVKPGTPAVDVDEDALKDLAGEVQDGDTVTVKLTVEKQDAPTDKADIDAVVTGDKENVLYLDLSLLKQVNDGEAQAITDAARVLEIAVDYDFTGKRDVTVYRKHGDNDAEKLTALTARPTENFADGSFFADSVNGVVYIYASKFSTYAIGYTAEAVMPTPTPIRRPHYTATPTQSPWPFTDVKTTDNCYEAVKYVYEKGWMLGTSDTTFSPEGELTRAMLAAVLYRAAGSPKAEGAPEFADTQAGQWYSDAIAWASQTQVLRGYGNGNFGPEDPVSREMLDMVMGRLKGEDPTWAGDAALARPATRSEIAQALMAQDKA